MITEKSVETFPYNHHPDIQDDHPQTLWRCPEDRFRIVFRSVFRPGAKVTGNLIAAVQAPSTRSAVPGIWYTKFSTTNRNELLFSAKLEFARRDPQWTESHVPPRVVRSTLLPLPLINRLRQLPTDLELAAGWDLAELIKTADETSLEDGMRAQARMC